MNKSSLKIGPEELRSKQLFKPHDANGIRCNMSIHLVTCTAVVTAGNTDGLDKALNGQTYMCKKETAEWMKQNLTYSNAEDKNLKHLKIASNPNTYSVSKYTKYVPEKVFTISTKEPMPTLAWL